MKPSICMALLVAVQGLPVGTARAGACPPGTQRRFGKPDVGGGDHTAQETYCARRVAGRWVRHGPYTYSEIQRGGLNSSISETGEYKDGKKHGRWVRTVEPHDSDSPNMDGRRKVVTTYQDGVQHGPSSEWKNGHLLEQGRYEGGKRVGAFLLGAEDGSTKTSGTYDAAGRRQGTWVTKDRAGRRREEHTYRDGKPVGPDRTWHANGRLAAETIYQRGAPVRQVEWHPSGRIAARHPYLDGKLHGVAWRWHENGKPASRTRYCRGVLVGRVVEWHPDGRLRSLVAYRARSRMGLTREWHPNGRLREVKEWRLGSVGTREERYDERGRAILRCRAVVEGAKVVGRCETPPRSVP